MGTPGWQFPAAQVSAPLQNRPSSQLALTRHSTQRLVVSLHIWPGQGLLPAAQPAAPVQTSTPLQNSPSEHTALDGVCTQASAASLQLSRVQAVPSAQIGGGPAAHSPASQISAPLQNSPSAQSAFTTHSGGIMQASKLSSHCSVGAGPVSSQGRTPGSQCPVAGWQVSAPLQNRPSSQSPWARQSKQARRASSHA